MPKLLVWLYFRLVSDVAVPSAHKFQSAHTFFRSPINADCYQLKLHKKIHFHCLCFVLAFKVQRCLVLMRQTSLSLGSLYLNIGTSSSHKHKPGFVDCKIRVGIRLFNIMATEYCLESMLKFQIIILVALSYLSQIFCNIAQINWSLKLCSDTLISSSVHI